MALTNITQLQPFNVNSSASFSFANVTSTANVVAGNVKTDNLLYANGTAWTFGSIYANSNVESYLPTYSGLIGGTLSTTAQPNISSVGTLTSLTVSGLVNATGGVKVGNIQDPSGTNTISLASGNVTMLNSLQVGTSGTGNVTATYFIGNGSHLTGLPATYANSNVASYLPTYTGNITGNIVTLTGNITSINANLGNLVTANYFSGNGSLLTSVTGANVTGTVANATYAVSADSSTTAATVTTNAQPNITSVGTLVDLTISGNLTVGGATEYTNVTNLYVKDPIIEQGGLANAGALTSNDGKDRGQLLHYYSSGVVDAFMGWDNSNAEFAFGSNVSVSSEVVTFNSLGNVRANYFLGNASQLVGTIANANYAAYAGNVTVNAQPNITSVGTLTSLITSGNLTSINADLGNLVTANYFSGNGSLLTSITGANVTGTVANATYSVTAGSATSATTAGTVTANAQPNITSVGTLVDTVLGSSNSLTGGNLVSANYFSGNGSLLTSITGANVTGTVANATYSVTAGSATTATSATTAGTVTDNAQPNITSVGILSNLTSAGTVNFTTAGNVSLGSNANVKLTGGTTGQYLQTDGTGNLAWATVSGGGGGSSIANGTSNVNISTANGNVQIVSNGNIVANVTGIGANITGTLNISGIVTATAGGVKVGNIQDPSGTNTVSIASGNVGILGGLSVGTGGAGNLTVSGKTDLGPVGNVKITGGTTGQVLTTNGSGVLSWATASSGGASITYTAATTPPGTANIADQWFNTTTNVLYEYMNDGVANYWVDVVTPTTTNSITSAYVNHNYTADGSTTTFDITLGCGVNDVLVFINGICQAPTLDYTINGSTLTLDSAPINGTRVQIRELPR